MAVDGGKSAGMVEVQRPPVAVGAHDNSAHPSIGHCIYGLASDSARPKVDPAVKVVVAQFRELAGHGKRPVQGLVHNELAPKRNHQHPGEQRSDFWHPTKIEIPVPNCYLWAMAESLDRIGVIQSQVHDLIGKYRLAVSELEQQANAVAEQDRKMRELTAQLKALRSENEELRLLISFNGDAAARAKLAKQLQSWSREINQVISKLQP